MEGHPRNPKVKVVKPRGNINVSVNDVIVEDNGNVVGVAEQTEVTARSCRKTNDLSQ